MQACPRAPGNAQDLATLGKLERIILVVPAPGLVASGKETGTAAEGWENEGYFPSL